MPKPLYIRTPFQPIAGSTASDYQLIDDLHSSTVGVNAANPERLKLQPVFPGLLTFKPLDATIPPDPSADDAPAILGHLYLELSPDGQVGLGQKAKDLNYGLVFAYLGVVLDHTFFKGTVVELLKGKTVTEGGKKLTTAKDISNAFARGVVSVQIEPGRGALNFVFPSLVQKSGATTAQIILAMGVRPQWNPYAKPPALKDLSISQILVDPDFVPIPIAYFYRMLSRLPAWSTLAADGHATHPFIDSVLASETLSVFPSGYMRWRRLRIFAPGSRSETSVARATFEGTTVNAQSTFGSSWTAPINPLGEIFVRRVDGEEFRLEARNRDNSVINLGTDLSGPGRDHLDLTWDSPTPGVEPARIDIAAFVPTQGDPLALPFLAIPYGTYDEGGLTVIVEGNTRRIVARRELVRPLQQLLQTFGFNIVSTTGRFDRPLSWALREFQIYAAMNTIAVEGDPSALRYADRLVATPNVTPYVGDVDGIFSAATATALRTWRQFNLRCPVVIESWTVNHGLRAILVADNMWNRSDNTVEENRVFVRDLTGHYTIPPDRIIYTVPPVALDKGRVLLGRYTHTDDTGPWCSNLSNITWKPDTDVTPECLVGRTLLASPESGSADENTVSTYKVINAVSYVENERAFDSVNGYDGAVISMGVQHWTACSGEELGPYLALLQTYEPAAYQTFFGRFGIRCSKTWPQGSALTNPMFKPLLAWSAPLQQRGLPYRSNNNIVTDSDWRSLPSDREDANYLRTWHWFYRWVMAARTSTAVQRRQWDLGRLRLRAILTAEWGTPAFGSIQQVFRSERMVTALLRAHVNSPASVIMLVPSPSAPKGYIGKASTYLRQAFSDSGLNSNPATWTQNNMDTLQAQLETQLTNALVERNRPSLHNAVTFIDLTFGKLKTSLDSFKFDTTDLAQL